MWQPCLPVLRKKATDLWIATQLNRLPDCDWALSSPLPDTLWPVFESNRWLLNDVCRLAVENLLYAARNGVWNPVSSAPSIRMAVVSTGIRMHVSVTCGGLNKHGHWKS
ncbi:hypothetical protein [Escherichia coli]|uniref:hypothetical protein n=1 Tax=Escherichia coli TaxID=562 RepID=UPI003BB9095C